MNNPLLIDARNVTKVFKDFWGRPKVTAVRGVDLAVPRGSIFGLLGPNGAGKSTLMKLILGHLYPTGGELSVLGRSPKDVDAKKQLGYVPERAAFYKNLTAEETLFLFGDILNLPRTVIRERVDQLLEMVGLQNARRRMVGEFSHGMGRRLGLAQALLNDPDLLLLDEPTAGLDPIGCYEVKCLIQTLGKRGKTVLMSSHLLADVQDVCDQIMIIYGGKVQQIGSTEELLASTTEVQLRMPAVAPEELEKAKTALAGAVAPESIQISYPTRSLEDYFLQVVRNADASDQETAGAKVGSGVAGYLKAEAENAILDELTKPKETTPEPAPEQPSEPEVNRNVIDTLSNKPAETDETKDKPAPDKKIDTDFLDSLTKPKS